MAQQPQGQGGAANANAVYYAQPQQQQQGTQQNVNWPQDHYAQNNYGQPPQQQAHENANWQQRPIEQTNYASQPRMAQFNNQEFQNSSAPQCSHGVPRENANELNSRARRVTWRRATPATYIEITIDGGKHLCLMDSGCEYSLIPRRLVPGATLAPVKMDVYAANGSLIRILGEMSVNFEIEGMPVQAHLLVSDQIDEFTLGYDWLVKNNIIWNFTGEHITFRNKPVSLKSRRASVKNVSNRIFVRERKVRAAKRGRYDENIRMNTEPRPAASNGMLGHNLVQYQTNPNDYITNESHAGRFGLNMRPEAHVRSVQARGPIKYLEPRSHALFGPAGEDLVSNQFPPVESIVYETPSGPAAFRIRSVHLRKKGLHWDVVNFLTLFFVSLIYIGLKKWIQSVKQQMFIILQTSLKFTTWIAFLPVSNNSEDKTGDPSTMSNVEKIKSEGDLSRRGYNGLQKMSPRAGDVTSPCTKEPPASTDVQKDPLLFAPVDDSLLYGPRSDHRDAFDDASQQLGKVEELLALSALEWERHCQGSVTKTRARFKDDQVG